MGKRYREPIDVTTAERGAPVQFHWRGAVYRVLSVLGHWREDSGWWEGGGLAVPQRDLWRVEARDGRPTSGVYELVREGEHWRLARVWD